MGDGGVTVLVCRVAALLMTGTSRAAKITDMAIAAPPLKLYRPNLMIQLLQVYTANSDKEIKLILSGQTNTQVDI